MTRRKKMFVLLLIMVVLITLSLGAEYFFGSQHRVSTQQNTFLAMPDYQTALHFASNVPTDERQNLQTQFTVVEAALASSSTDYNAWIALGGLRKQAGDYQGAAQIWIYASQKWPFTVVAFNNLGDLYMNYLKDYPQAETNYKQVLTIDPTNITAYYSLFTMYRYLYKTNTSAAADILKLGLKNNPGNPDLIVLQAELQSGNK